MADIGIDVTHRGADAVVRLTGDLDLGASDPLTAALHRVERERPQTLIVDLRGLDFMDSTGVRLLVEADARARADGRRLVVAAGSAGPRRVIELLGLEERLMLTDDAPDDGRPAGDGG